MLNPMRANISAITVEYGLYEGRFWLPKVNVAEGEAQAGFLRVPVKFEESYKYNDVNGTMPVPRIPTPAELGLAADDSLGRPLADRDDRRQRPRARRPAPTPRPPRSRPARTRRCAATPSGPTACGRRRRRRPPRATPRGPASSCDGRVATTRSAVA
jgi:hypothetical protein